MERRRTRSSLFIVVFMTRVAKSSNKRRYLSGCCQRPVHVEETQRARVHSGVAHLVWIGCCQCKIRITTINAKLFFIPRRKRRVTNCISTVSLALLSSSLVRSMRRFGLHAAGTKLVLPLYTLTASSAETCIDELQTNITERPLECWGFARVQDRACGENRPRADLTGALVKTIASWAPATPRGHLQPPTIVVTQFPHT